MAYLVNITARAERDFESLYLAIGAWRSPAAEKWYRGLRAAVLSLENHPNRCATSPENANLRHLLYGRKPNVYRVIYRIAEKRMQVDALHIRHGSRQGFQDPDIV